MEKLPQGSASAIPAWQEAIDRFPQTTTPPNFQLTHPDNIYNLMREFLEESLKVKLTLSPNKIIVISKSQTPSPSVCQIQHFFIFLSLSKNSGEVKFDVVILIFGPSRSSFLLTFHFSHNFLVSYR